MRPLFASAVLAALLANGCTEPESTTTTTSTGGGGGGGSRPDPVIHEQTSHAEPVTDDPFAQDVATLFRTPAVIPDVDIRSLAFLGTDLLAGTATGVAFLPQGAASFQPLTVFGTGAVIDIALTDGGSLVLARADGVEVLAPGKPVEVWAAPGETITCVAAQGEDVFIGTDLGLSRIDAAGPSPVAAAQGIAVRDLAVIGDVVWMATSAGVKRYDAVADMALPALTAPSLLLDDDVRALAVAADGQGLLAATQDGLSRIYNQGSAAVLTPVGVDGLPNGDLRAVAENGDVVLTGHGIGATAVSSVGKEHYHSLRWLPDEEVTAVAVSPGGTRWIGTHAGLTKIALETRTLAEKAAVYEPQVQVHWRMDGIVADGVDYADPWDLTAEPSRGDFDNDGLWTQMQVAAWCLAYAETKDEAYYQNARRAMDTLFLFFDVPGETFEAAGMKRGFITRSLVRDDEGALFDGKADQPNWHLQKLGEHSYYWKDDTSSDEYAGHYFGIPLFYDLCAKTEDERQAIRDRIELSTAYIIDGGYELIDLDGMPTKFGRWAHLASAVDGDLGACLADGKPLCAESYGGGGWLNSMEILGHLLAAWHITGNPRFYDEYERLAIEERYGDMVPLTDHTFTVTSRSQQNHSDHELASLAYFTLLRYEPNVDRREKWVKSILDFHGWEKLERNALEIAVIASATEGASLADAARTLREWPLDRREWAYDNGHRQDVVVDPEKDRFDNLQFTTVLPYDEIRTLKWNGNPYAVAGGGSGQSVQGPWPYLLPYWMLRRAGAIVAP